MKKIVGFILGLTMLASIFQFSIEIDAYARTMRLEGGGNIAADSNNEKDSNNNNETVKGSADINKEILQPITVLNCSERSCIGIRQAPSVKAKIIGRVYGSLTKVKVLQVQKGYAYIEAVDYNTGRRIRGYIGQTMIKARVPQKPYCVIADIGDQKVYVYKDELSIKEMLCSTGKANSATPVGVYLIGGKGRSFYSSKYREGAYNWVRFNNGFLFHSVPFDSRRRIISSEEKKLGKKVSHGCIRLSMGDSKWFYNTIPAGTAVIVQE